jgi:hypothetical protein
MSPTDRAAAIRAEIERVFLELLDRLEDRFREVFAEHETDIRREYSADE